MFEDSARLRLLYELGLGFAARTELEELCSLVIAKCREVFDAEGASVLLHDSAADELYFPYVTHDDPEAAQRLLALRFPADRGLAGTVLREGRSLRVDDVANDPRFYGNADQRSGATTRNLIAAPLRTAQGVIGVLQVINRHRDRPFRDDDVDFLEALAGSVAVAIENVRLLEQTRQQVIELRQAMEERATLRALQRELDIARQLQLSILPRGDKALPERDDVELHAAMIPARDVGGDFYDFFLLGDHTLGLVIGDVSGKGMSAALFMAVSRTLLKATAATGQSPAACLDHVNRLLNAENSAEMFVTLFYAVLDTASGQLIYSNGGHNPPLLRSADGTVSWLPATTGMLLGVFDDATFSDRTVTLAAGDTLLLYTDGVTEAADSRDELYGPERLEQLITDQPRADPTQLIAAIVADVEHHANGAPQADDITLLAVTFRGRP